MTGAESSAWRLDDVEARAKQNPRTFFIPPPETRRNLQIGDTVKLVFLIEDAQPAEIAAERMWVEVVGLDQGLYAGRLLNQPSAIATLEPGDVVDFGPEHVAAIGVDESVLGYRVNDKAVVSVLLAEADKRPGYLWRGRPSRPGDSGWQLLKGDESDDERNDPSRAEASTLGYLTDKFPELADVFREGKPGDAWRWNEAGHRYERAN